jgi:hypothetical protein
VRLHYTSFGSRNNWRLQATSLPLNKLHCERVTLGVGVTHSTHMIRDVFQSLHIWRLLHFLHTGLHDCIDCIIVEYSPLHGNTDIGPNCLYAGGNVYTAARRDLDTHLLLAKNRNTTRTTRKDTPSPGKSQRERSPQRSHPGLCDSNGTGVAATGVP